VPFVTVVVLASFAVVVPVAVTTILMWHPSEPGPGPESLRSMGLIGRLAIGSVVAPLIETGLFQSIPIRVLRGRIGLTWPTVVCTSAALFAAGHTYSAAYVIHSFLVGLVLAYAYAVKEAPADHPFLLVFLVHAVRNGVASFAA